MLIQLYLFSYLRFSVMVFRSLARLHVVWKLTYHSYQMTTGGNERLNCKTQMHFKPLPAYAEADIAVFFEVYS